MTSALPRHLPHFLVENLEGASDDETLLNKLKHLPINDLITFTDYGLYDSSYSQNHRNLIQKIWIHIDEFYDQALDLDQKVSVLAIINNHSRSIQDYLPLNFTIVSEDLHLKTNRLWLERQSEYFGILSQFLKKQGKPLELNITGLGPAAANFYVRFFFDQRFTPINDEGVAAEILDKAFELGLHSLIREFPSLCELTISNVSFYWELAAYYELEPLKSYIIKFLSSIDVDNPAFLFEANHVLKHAQKKGNLEIEAFCFHYLKHQLPKQLQVLLKDKQLQEIDKGKEKEPTQSKQLKIAYKFVKQFKSFSPEIIENLTCQELLVLLNLFPEKFKHLKLTGFNDAEIEVLIRSAPTTIENLDLSGTALSAETMDEIGIRFPTLHTLNLAGARKRNPNNPMAPFKVDWSGLRQLKNLISLDVTSCNDAAEHLEKIIENNAENLKILRMGHCHLTLVRWNVGWLTRNDQYVFSEDDQFANRCLQLIANSGKNLKELDLSHIIVSGAILHEISLNDHLYRNLERLSIAHNDSLNEFELMSLGSQFRKLRGLNLSGIKKLNAATLESILTNLGAYPDEKKEKNSSNLEELNIEGIFTMGRLHQGKLQDEIPRIFGMIAANCPQLRSLTFDLRPDVANQYWNCGTHLKPMRTLLEKCPHLHTLNGRIPDGILNDLYQYERIKLRELHTIHDPTSIALESIAQHPLESLAIDSLYDIRGLSLPFLRKLILSTQQKMGITPTDIIELVTQNFPLLRELKCDINFADLDLKSLNLNDLRSLDIGITALDAIPTLLKSIPKLRKLSLKGAKLSAEIVAEIIQSAPRLEALALIRKHDAKIETIPASIFSSTCHLRKLEVPRMRINENDLLELVKNNPRLEEVIFLDGIKLIKTPDGEPILEVAADLNVLDKRMKHMLNLYPQFKVIGKRL